MTMPPLTPEQRMQLDRESRQAAREAIGRALVYEKQPSVELVSNGPDEIRSSALDAAVMVAGPLTFEGPDDVVAAARIFEAYLREADAGSPA